MTTMEIGLCAACAHVRRVRSQRGSVFYRCGRADRDPRFPRYPPLPVHACPGYAPGTAGDRDDTIERSQP